MAEKPNSHNEPIDPAGGADNKGDVETSSGDFIGRSYHSYGDEVGRDKVERKVGNVAAQQVGVPPVPDN